MRFAAVANRSQVASSTSRFSTMSVVMMMATAISWSTARKTSPAGMR
jgi:hypothetical protein